MCEKTKQLGQLMRNKRKSKKMSVRELSELTGIHPGAIIKFELGVTDMSISRIFKISEVLKLSLAKVSPENIDMSSDIETLKDNLDETIVKITYLLQPMRNINNILKGKTNE
jgi:transcriptional regulator with XRE-family HTH domain